MIDPPTMKTMKLGMLVMKETPEKMTYQTLTTIQKIKMVIKVVTKKLVTGFHSLLFSISCLILFPSRTKG